MSDTPPATEVARDGLTPGEAFSVLGNETRLSVLLVLWEAYDPRDPDATLSFSELFRRVDYGNAGNFNYHLEKLVGYFVHKTDEGYALRNTGLRLVQSVVASTGVRTLPETPVDFDCPICDGATAVAYEDEELVFRCTECAGYFDTKEAYPRGTLTVSETDPACLAERDPTAALYASWLSMMHHAQLAVEGVCAVCTGPISGSLDVCPDHHEGICPTCDRGFELVYHFECTVCKAYIVGPSWAFVTHHPEVAAFYRDHEAPLGYDVRDLESVKRGKRHMRQEQTLVSVEPARVRAVLGFGDEELVLTLDEDARVLDATRDHVDAAPD